MTTTERTVSIVAERVADVIDPVDVVERATSGTIAELHELRSMPTARAVGHTAVCDACVVLPQRFDVHRMADVLGELERELRSSEHVTIDGSAVEMIDLVALAGTERLIARHPNVVIHQPSVALRVTSEFTGSDLTSSFVGHHLVEAA